MTFRAFIEYLGDHPTIVLLFFVGLPILSFVIGWITSEEGHLSPWKYIYSTLIYLVCIPGVFAIALSIYLFLFERRSIFDTDIYTQVLPIVSMLASVFIIKNNVDLNLIPGFDRLSGLIMMIFVTLVLMWLIDKTHIYAFAYIGFGQLILIFLVLLLLIRWGWSRFFSNS